MVIPINSPVTPLHPLVQVLL